LEDERSKDNEMSRRIQKIMNTEVRKTWIAEAKGKRKETEKGRKERRERENEERNKEKEKEKQDNKYKESSRRMGNLG